MGCCICEGDKTAIRQHRTASMPESVWTFSGSPSPIPQNPVGNSESNASSSSNRGPSGESIDFVCQRNKADCLQHNTVIRRSGEPAQNPGKLDHKLGGLALSLSVSHVPYLHALQPLPRFLLDCKPGADTATWGLLHEMFRFQRFWKVGPVTSEQAVVNQDMRTWCQHTWEQLAQFQMTGDYATLSRQLVKFYSELQEAAAVCTSTELQKHEHGWCQCPAVCNKNWKAGYDLIVSASVLSHNVHTLE